VRQLNDIVRLSGLRPEDCTVMLHIPGKGRFRRQLAAVFPQRRAPFETCRGVHAGPATATARGYAHALLSFIGQEFDVCVFAGACAVRGHEVTSTEWATASPEIRALRTLRDEYGLDHDIGVSATHFEPARIEALEDFVGRLAIAPRPARAYVRLAENLDADVVEISAENRFDPPPLPWRSWCLSGPELRALGPLQEVRLRDWRGICPVRNVSDGALHVGGAFGTDTLPECWQTHAAKDRGIKVNLSTRDPGNFRFPTLERVSPDMPAEDGTALEMTWIDRSHTRRPGLNE